MSSAASLVQLEPASQDSFSTSNLMALLAVSALVDEATLTPKPALVDGRGSGAHRDLNLPLMLRSAHSLFPAFVRMAKVAGQGVRGQELREQLASIGRDGEVEMMAATGGSNSHRGAIWTLGLLIAGALLNGPVDAGSIAERAGAVARIPDRWAPKVATHGSSVAARYGIRGARAEAEAGFPHAVDVGLPALRAARGRGLPEAAARLEALLSIMATLEDTCVLHRGGELALEAAREGARAVLATGDLTSKAGQRAYDALERRLLELNASPGGSADLLAATLFLDRLAGFLDEQPSSGSFWR